jgi:uncharacterized membrane-anchored protein
MTTERRNLWLAIAAVALGQAAVLGWMIWDRTSLLANGREVVLEVIPVDPRSLFRGDYVILGSTEQPADVKPDEVVIRGRVEYVYDPPKDEPPGTMVNLHYGIESFFVPEGTGRELEKMVGEKKISAVIAVDDGGTAAIKGLMSEGQRVYDEPLL